ncbi:MAG: hypothetical protein IKM49_00910 [Ruminococcus sp.]|nr:hypothetical protein [Ruminococcus sp.]
MKVIENEAEKNNPLGGSLPLLLAIFLAIGSVVYIMYKSWSDKAYAEKWKDYDECGI